MRGRSRRAEAGRRGDVEPSVADTLIGRDRELELIESFVEDAAIGGGALLLSGDAGVGATVLLDAAEEMAEAVGTRVLRAAGVEFEADVGFSGLNQVLRPLHGELGRLNAVHRDALSVALGLGGGPPADRLIVSTAALALMREAGADSPLLVVVDDLHWLDRPSAVVLGFAARRLAGSRVGLLAASRADAEGFFDRGGLPERELEPLDDVAAAQLIAGRFPTLAPKVVQRVLAEAQGNPLALLELPAASTGPRRGTPAVLPRSRRLQTLFASRIAGLPDETRQLLLLTALDGTGELGVLQAAAPGEHGLEHLIPAERARLVGIDDAARRVVFRHPLVRSTVVELSSATDCRQAHRALAEAHVEQPERRASHLADAAVDADERVASLLDETARTVLGRGDAVGAVEALLRAADLSPRGADRSRRLAEAAYVGADVAGELRSVSRLLMDAGRADPRLGGSLEAAVAAAFLLINGDGDVDTAHRLLVGALETRGEDFDANDNALTEAIHMLLMVCLFGGGRSELWDPLHAALERLEPRPPDVLSLCAALLGDPARATPALLEDLEATIRSLHEEGDPARIIRVGMAALFVDRGGGCREALWRVVADGREGGAVSSAIVALIQLCFDDVLTGRWDEAERLADEGLELCESRGYRSTSWPLCFGEAVVAAARGDDEKARRLADEMARWAAPRRAGVVDVYSHQVRLLAAAGRGDYEEVYREAVAISPPGELPSHVQHAPWIAMDLVEAAVRTDRHAEAAAHVAALRSERVAAISPRFALLVDGCAAIAAPDVQALDLFERALSVPGVERWPFELARVQLAYGGCLRRSRAPGEARRQLTAALETFRLLGAEPWVGKAADELRAGGQVQARAGSAALSPQEREISLLAATGLTNKEIGRRLHLSHRTVGAHLYRAFPKLGITSRAALRDALATSPPRPPDAEAGR